MFAEVLDRTPGLFFTLTLIAFTIGMMFVSVQNAKKANDAKESAVKK
jgi:hypothetical protein